jgi:hypothetical protein
MAVSMAAVKVYMRKFRREETLKETGRQNRL